MNYILFNPRGWILDVPGRNNNSQNNYNNGNNGNNGNEGFPFNIPFFGGNNGGRGSFGGRHEVTKPAERTFITDFDGPALTEMIQLGGWNDRGEIASEEVALQADTDYTFVFWLNGGENDRGSEVCQLQIFFSRQYAYPNVYKLNRNLIKPRLHRQGWELYLIPFHTAPSEQKILTEFHFVAKEAPLFLKHAEVPDFYKNWADEPDEYAAFRPQRHNLIFEDGWPSISMYGGDKYSTEAIKARLLKKENEKQAENSGNDVDKSFDFASSEEEEEFEPDTTEYDDLEEKISEQEQKEMTEENTQNPEEKLSSVDICTVSDEDLLKEEALDKEVISRF